MKLLQLYKKEIHFSNDVIALLKKINKILLAWALYGISFMTISSLIITLFKPAGERFIMVGVSTHTILHCFVLLILYMLIHSIQEGYKMKTEQDLVV